MFTFTPKRQVKAWPATIKLARDNGEVAEFTISLDLTLLPADDYLARVSEGSGALFDAILDGFTGIAGADGEALADTPENRAALYQHPPFTEAVITAYRQANAGEAARKN